VTEEFTHKLCLLAYDVASENQKGLNDDLKKKLANLRSGIYYALKHKYNCFPLQHSLWRIHDPKRIPEIKEAIKEWKEQYKQLGFEHVKIEIFKMGLDDVGYEAFIELEAALLLEWLNGIVENLEEKRDKISKGAMRLTMKRLDLASEILADLTDSKRFNEISDVLELAYDIAHEIINKRFGGKI